MDKTYVTKETDVKRAWYVVDAEGQTLGRLASEIAQILRGKHKPTYQPHVDTGDYVIVVNCEKIHVTGKRLEDKMYYRHSGYPSGLTAIPLGEMLERHPERVMELAVNGMLPKGRLGHQIRKKLKVYAGPEHPHQAQEPQKLEF